MMWSSSVLPGVNREARTAKKRPEWRGRLLLQVQIKAWVVGGDPSLWAEGLRIYPPHSWQAGTRFPPPCPVPSSFPVG